MRTYNRRFVNSRMQSVADQSIEFKNGIIWSIDTTQHECGVRLLGSTDIIMATFPPSRMITPNWIQLGSPVQLRHPAGLKNALEITGPGQVIPTPTTGTYIPAYPASSLPDVILSGCDITEIPLEPQMGILIQTGAVRIGGATVDIDQIKMESTYYKMDMGGKINQVAAAIEIASAPTAIDNCRFDMFVVGTDAIIDSLTGTTFLTTAATAVVPDLPADHIELGRVFIPSGKTIIRNSDLNIVWAPARAQSLAISADDTDLSSAETTAAITVQVLDQFNNAFIKNEGLGWRIELEIINGTGSVSSTEGNSTSLIAAYAGSSAEYTFTYERLGTTADVSPVFTARLTAPSITKNFVILLRNSSGEIMTT